MEEYRQKKIVIRGCLSLCALFVLVFLQVYMPDAAASYSAKTDFERFPTGEKLTYNISFEKFENAAYAELFVVSRGTIGDRKAVEMRARLKSRDMVSAAFFLFDHSRVVYASEETGFPLYQKDVSNTGGLPVEKISNFLTEPSTNHELLTLLYKVRENGGAGSYSFFENGQSYSIDFATTGGEKVITGAGEFDTQLTTVSSPYFTELGISEVRINFSADEERVPVRIRVTTPKGTFRALLAGKTIIAPTPIPVNTAAPAPTPIVTPAVEATPTPYQENQPLSDDLPFAIGENLRYSVRQNDVELAQVRLQVTTRKLIGERDSLILKADVSDDKGGLLFSSKDEAEAEVDPYTLVPFKFNTKFFALFSAYSRLSIFDQAVGTVTSQPTARADVPIGTHSLLSFVYAVRSFNLRPSKDSKNPVNDTRVSMFFNGKAYIITLRPSESEKIQLNGQTTNAQMISIITGDREIDRLQLKLWLSTDQRRIPLRFEAGNYVADLIR